MGKTVQEISAPDAAAKASEAVEQYGDTTEDLIGEKLTINMGPSHPATHGVLRIVLELDGEVITKATPDVGFLHRGDEKIAENMQYNQFVPYTDRLDYLAPLANNVAYALAVRSSWAGSSRHGARPSVSSAVSSPASPPTSSGSAPSPSMSARCPSSSTPSRSARRSTTSASS